MSTERIKEAYANGTLTVAQMENALALAVWAEDNPQAERVYSDEGFVVWVKSERCWRQPDRG